jgi:murein DD-endopeptidase MepM/ murein hydrolase activator NlpD
MPLPNAVLPDDPELLPGGGLQRRGGLVEGVSFYRKADGRAFSCGEQVSCIREGYIVRADHEWIPLSARECEAYTVALRTGRDERFIDRVRGRQVWVQGDDGTVVRYCRLSAVDPAIQVGLKAPAGTTLGSIGNSGTVEEVRGTGRDCHLYLEIWPAPDRWLGQGDSPRKARERWAELFGTK